MTQTAYDLMTPVILSGGAGTRLWPLSRSAFPKQLLPLTGELSLLQATARRAADPSLFAAPLIVAGEDHRFLIKDQLAEIDLEAQAIFLEPEGRNTAAAIALAARHLHQAHGPDSLMLVMPSDHVIIDVAAFHSALMAALPAVRGGALATFGLQPSSPQTGYGYIQLGALLENQQRVHHVARFVEKPDLATAQAYIAAGDYVWNSGIFLLHVGSYLAELATHAPLIATHTAAALQAATVDGIFMRPDAPAFRSCPSISIDYAVMEHTDKACVVPVEMGWSDVGTFDMLWSVGDKNADGNLISGDVIALDSHNNLLRGDDGLLLTTVGLEDMVVVATRDAVMVAPKNRAQDVKMIVDTLQINGRDLHKFHHIIHRPWGTYQTTDMGDRFQTKRIVVNPGASLSLQMHHHRAEHWVVVSGTARVTVGDQVSLLQENQSTYIPAGTVHRLENPGKVPLHLIEVQCGPYLGEDDIVRLEDSYGRITKS